MPPLSTTMGATAPDRAPGMTVLCHPDPGRVGERAWLPRLLFGGVEKLSRVDPLFERSGRNLSVPLTDPFISRKSITLTRSENGSIQVGGALERAALVADGTPRAAPFEIAEEQLETGVVLELARRAVVLFHMLPPQDDERPDLGIIGGSEAIGLVRDNILQVAQTDIPVLLSGETGTGKELVASAIHEHSARRDEPYYAINMAAIPGTMAAAELFGHARGAFTGATNSAQGYFDHADGGTLFLDEVGDTPPDVQAALLRVLETGEIQAVGQRQIRQVDVRLVAATESDLERAVGEGSIRLSFLQRLSGFQIHVPPLRQRRDDIGRLLVHFLRTELESLGEGTSQLGAPTSRDAKPWLAAPVVAELVRHDWPGNVRQLRNVARQLVLSCRNAPALVLDASVERVLSVTDRHKGKCPEADEAPAGEASEKHPPPRPDRVERVDQISEEELKAALKQCDYQPAAAARLLGIGRTSMYKLLKQTSSIRAAKEIPEAELRACHGEHDGDIAAMARQLEVSARSLKVRLGQLGLTDDS